jgi:hypothetical protein
VIDTDAITALAAGSFGVIDALRNASRSGGPRKTSDGRRCESGASSPASRPSVVRNAASMAAPSTHHPTRSSWQTGLTPGWTFTVSTAFLGRGKTQGDPTPNTKGKERATETPSVARSHF